MIRRIIKNRIFLLGLCLLLYPLAGEIWNGFRQLSLQRAYEETVSGEDEARRREMLERADAYNRAHRNNTLDACGMGDDYEKMLVQEPGEAMGILDIPKIGVHMKIRHGTGSEVLKDGAGHLPGTSLPVGGESTHAVLSAHCGLPGSRLFTDLERLESGDPVYLNVQGRVLIYEVTGQEVVLPEGKEAAQALSIRDGEDLLTMLTCTPYGINTHRRLVHCRRVFGDEKTAEDEIREGRKETWKHLWRKTGITGGLCIGLILLHRRRNRA